MTSPRAPQALIDQYHEEGVEFFYRILKVDFEACLVSDDSLLSDFALLGTMPVSALPLGAPAATLFGVWDQYVRERVAREYAFQLATTHVSLVALFEQLRHAAVPQPLH